MEKREYVKLRGRYGAQPMFSETPPEFCDTIPNNPIEQKKYILRNPVHTGVQFGPTYAPCKKIETIRTDVTNTGCLHQEGGWPIDVNPHDIEATHRHRRRVEKEHGFVHCVLSLSDPMEHLLDQNDAIDVYEFYYHDTPPFRKMQPTTCRLINEYRDVSEANRPISSICWRPDDKSIFAVAYCDIDHDRLSKSCNDAYIWDMNNAMAPQSTLKSERALVDLQYSPRNIDLLVGGMVNGQVAVWDRRTPYQPCAKCPEHIMHRDIVRNVRFIYSKPGTEFFSGGTDGCCKWWDMRKLDEPTDEVIVQVVSGNEEPLMENSYGVSYLQYEPTMPTRYLVGTETGLVVSGNRKGKNAKERLPYKIEAHDGPVWRVERNPNYMKTLLTVGDFRARIWSEDCRDSSVLWTPPNRYYVTDAAWSPTRISLMLVTQENGVMAMWDFLRRYGEPILNVQVCKEALVRIEPHGAAPLVACGNSKGSTFTLELSQGAADTEKEDKILLTSLIERESKREHILEARALTIKMQHTLKAPGPSVSAFDLNSSRTNLAGDKNALPGVTADYFQAVHKELSAMYS